MTDYYTGAIIHEDRYRLLLWRRWKAQASMVMFVLFRMPEADHNSNDHVMRRLMGFAKLWGFGGLYVASLDADSYGETDEINQKIILKYAGKSEKVVLAWGMISKSNHYYWVAQKIRKKLKGKTSCFSINKDGSPRHPLYVEKTRTLIEYR